MRRILLFLVAVVVIVGVFAAAGYTGYRLGFAQGAQSMANRDETPRPGLSPFDEFGPRGMPGRNFRFDHKFEREFGMSVFHRMRFGFFSPFMFLSQILLLGLIAGLVYWLFARSGWRLTRTGQATETAARPVETEETSRRSPSED